MYRDLDKRSCLNKNGLFCINYLIEQEYTIFLIQNSTNYPQ